jgi:N-acyl-D-aspartate/D-glutamate deacylase
MATLLRDGLAAGGIGFSTSRGRSHQDVNGDPVPSRFANHDEIITLASICREFPGTSLEFIPHHRPYSDEDRELIIAMTVAAERPVNWNLLNTNATTLKNDLSMMGIADEAAERGGKVIALIMPMEFPGRISFATGFLLDSIAGWAKDMVRPVPEKLTMLRNPDERARLNALAKQDAQRAELVDWGNKLITETVDPSLRHYMGRRVDEVAAEEGKDPFDALLDIACTDELRTTFSRLTHEGPDDWQARQRTWRDPRTLFGASDAGAHVDYFATFQYTTSFLARGVRERGVFELEEAVASLTGDPARAFGLRGRGRLVEGAWADILVFDPSQIAPGPTVTRTDLPGGATRLHSDAIGIDRVLVNGETIVEVGEYTEARPGTLLRSGRDTLTPPLAG